MEETKCYCGHTTYCDCGPEEPNPFELPKALSDDVFYKSLEPNQESLEEVAEKYAEIYRCPATNENEYCRHDIISAFNNGAKWQSERMYSEDEVKTLIDIINWYDDNSDVRPNFEIPEIKKGIALIDWFIDFEEQFKKK